MKKAKKILLFILIIVIVSGLGYLAFKKFYPIKYDETLIVYNTNDHFNYYNISDELKNISTSREIPTKEKEMADLINIKLDNCKLYWLIDNNWQQDQTITEEVKNIKYMNGVLNGKISLLVLTTNDNLYYLDLSALDECVFCNDSSPVITATSYQKVKYQKIATDEKIENIDIINLAASAGDCESRAAYFLESAINTYILGSDNKLYNTKDFFKTSQELINTAACRDGEPLLVNYEQKLSYKEFKNNLYDKDSNDIITTKKLIMSYKSDHENIIYYNVTSDNYLYIIKDSELSTTTKYKKVGLVSNFDKTGTDNNTTIIITLDSGTKIMLTNKV